MKTKSVYHSLEMPLLLNTEKAESLMHFLCCSTGWFVTGFLSLPLNFIALDAAEPGYYMFVFTPGSDADYQVVAALIASSIRNI